MSQTFGDIYWEIRSSRGISEAERYKCAFERDGHSKYQTAYNTKQAMNGAESYSLRDHAAYAFRDLERRDEIKRQEEQERLENQQQEQRRREREQWEMEMQCQEEKQEEESE